MKWLALLVLMGCTVLATQSAAVPPASVTKKLLEFGWDKPRPAQLSAAQLDSSVFDGVVFASSAGDRVFKPRAQAVSAFDTDIAGLKKNGSSKLKNSFYLLNVNTAAWDWFSDANWAAAEANLYQHARVAKAGGLRGLMLDPEVYEFDLWAYASQVQRGKYSFAQFESKLRQRGAQTMRAFERAYPGITVLSLFAFSAFEAAPNSSYEAAHAGLAEDGSLGLYAAFLEGMLGAASDAATLIDGYESSYNHLRPAAFDAGRTAALKDAQLFVAPSLREKFQKRFRFANAVFVDGAMNFLDSARFFGYYLKSDDDRRALIAQNVYHGLRTSDEFVWVYAEGVNWWQRTINVPSDFGALETSIKRASLEWSAGKALSNDPSAAVGAAEVAFKAKVDVGGDILGKSGLGISFGALTKHCATWANAQRWSCTMPNGSSFTVTPTATGVTFAPASQSFEKLTKSNWDVNFTAK